MVQAAVKSGPLGQTADPRLLAALAEAIPAAVDDALVRDDASHEAFTPMLPVLSAGHEAPYSRPLRS